MKQTIIIFLLLFAAKAYCQSNSTIAIQYRMKPDRSVARDDATFYFNIQQGTLKYQDDYSTKQFLIKFDRTFYDNAGLYNVVYATDVVEHTLQRKPKSELGLFSIIYDEKNGNVVGIKTVFQNSDVETYLTEFGATLLKKI